MQLTCPNCSEPVTAEHINIQQMTAVCPACHSVFRFDPPQEKIKRRKVRQPDALTLTESDDHLNMAFRTNFRLDRNESFVTASVLSMMFTFLTMITLGGVLANDVPLAISLGFGLVALIMYYGIAVITYNRTHIDVTPEAMTISRKPLPWFNQTQDINLSGIERIDFEETPASLREAYDTPRYNVRAMMMDGHHRVIMSDLVYDYAAFITQHLNQYLALDAPPDVSRLMDETEVIDDDPLADESVSPDQANQRQ